MGQKVNPKSFRLITYQKSLSQWYASKKNYANLLEEDNFLRDYCVHFFKAALILSRVEITRFFYSTLCTTSKKPQRSENISLLIIANSPGPGTFIKVSKKIFKNLSTIQLKALLEESESFSSLSTYYFQIISRKLLRFFSEKHSKNYFLNFHFITNCFLDPALLCHYIGTLLKQRVPFRRVLKGIIHDVTLYSSIIGIKIQLSGCLDEVDMARTEWIQYGQIPTHTLSIPLDYATQKVKTKKGIVGIKTWLNLSK